MKNWNKIRPVIDQVLREPRYPHDGDYKGQPCFLTAYQIAVLVDRRDPSLKEPSLPIGGKGVGSKTSFAQQIARELSAESKTNPNLEIRFLSTNGLDKFTFTGDDKQYEPSSDEFSMFRLIE